MLKDELSGVLFATSLEEAELLRSFCANFEEDSPVSRRAAFLAGDFFGVEVPGDDLAEVDFFATDFFGADLLGADFFGVDFLEEDFLGADLFEAVCDEEDFFDADFFAGLFEALPEDEDLFLVFFM
ncbi:MAG: hypothetical protein H0V61_00575 [Chitinophagales bacterium]|nr:hypothetical protein [Chitinophagales bacterium]